MGCFDETRQRHVTDLIDRFPERLDALTWDPAQLAAAREAGLRALLAHAAANSPWHRARLAGINVAAATEADLASLPTMTKQDVMRNFDGVVTDRRLTLDVVEAHLRGLEDGPAYLFDEYQVVATGGSSGTRTILVWDWDGWIDCFISLSRYQLSRDRGQLGAGPIAAVAADHPSHMSAAIQATFSNPLIDMQRIPATLPIEEVVHRLNGIQPETLLGYASMIHRLALEAAAGRLRIAPRKVQSGSEALLPETRLLVAEVWGLDVDNGYGASESGAIAHTCGHGPWLHLSDDLLIIEVEDDRVLVTNLMNKVMPLIRYELEDRTRLLDVHCPCGSAHRVIGDVEGRSDDTFTFSDGRAVHPIVLSSAIGKERTVAEYQVRQRGDALDIGVVPNGDPDVVGLQATVERALENAGAFGIKASVTIVSDLPRHGTTGKLRRYVPAR